MTPSVASSLRRFVALLSMALPLGCASARRSPPLAEPVNTSNPTLAHGELVFMQHCNQCHPGGAGGLGPALNDKPFFAWQLKYQVRNGLGVMPYFPKAKISDAQLDDLGAYLIALREARPLPQTRPAM
jgi:mono/diheme cytochrome c family protein